MSRNHHLICLPHHAPKIIDGTKTTTIRAPRSRQIEVGDTITFARWTAKPYRSKQELVRVVKVTSVRKIRVNPSSTKPICDSHFFNDVCKLLFIVKKHAASLTAMVDYLTSEKQPEFSGFIYGWDTSTRG